MAAILEGGTFDAIYVIHRAIIRGLNKGAQIVRNGAIMNVTGRVLKRDTGHLAQNITAGVTETGGGGILRVGTRVKYGGYWERGFYRRQFTIFPKNAKALRFQPKGAPGFIFRKKVTIPAGYFAARPWLRPAAEDALPQIKRLIEAEVARDLGSKFGSVNLDIRIA